MTMVRDFEGKQQILHNILKGIAHPEEMILQEELHSYRLSI